MNIMQVKKSEKTPDFSGVLDFSKLLKVRD